MWKLLQMCFQGIHIHSVSTFITEVSSKFFSTFLHSHRTWECHKTVWVNKSQNTDLLLVNFKIELTKNSQSNSLIKSQTFKTNQSNSLIKSHDTCHTYVVPQLTNGYLWTQNWPVIYRMTYCGVTMIQVSFNPKQCLLHHNRGDTSFVWLHKTVFPRIYITAGIKTISKYR